MSVRRFDKLDAMLMSGESKETHSSIISVYGDICDREDDECLS